MHLYDGITEGITIAIDAGDNAHLGLWVGEKVISSLIVETIRVN